MAELLPMHKTVLRSVRGAEEKLGEIGRHNFAPSSYVNKQALTRRNSGRRLTSLQIPAHAARQDGHKPHGALLR
jgi:hypothetical protein